MPRTRAAIEQPRISLASEAGQALVCRLLYIDPETCIDCGACVPVCPVQAIYALEALPEESAHFAQVEVDWYARKK